MVVCTRGAYPAAACALCGHFRLPRSFDDPVIEDMQCLGAQSVGEAGSACSCRALSGNRPDRTSAAPGCRPPAPASPTSAPPVEVLAQQHPQVHLHRRRMPSVYQRVAITLPQIGSHLSIQLVILQQLIQPFEHRVRLLRYFRHSRKDIFWGKAVDEHAVPSFSERPARILSPEQCPLLAMKSLHRPFRTAYWYYLYCNRLY